MQAAVVKDGLGLVVVDVGMAAQLLQVEFVDVELLGLAGGVDDEVTLGRLRKTLDFIELADADITSQPTAMTHNLLGIIGTNAWYLLQLVGVGHIEHDV